MTGTFVRRGLLLLVAPVALVAIFAGLARLGWPIAGLGARAPDHGPLLVIGVFGTVIALERAVALGKTWGYVGAWCGGLAALALLLRFRLVVPALVLGASIGTSAVNVAIVWRRADGATLLMLVGTLVYLLGNVAWLAGVPVYAVTPAWMAFFVLTIVAERLELSRLAPTPARAKTFLLLLGALMAISVAAGFWERLANLPVRFLGGVFVLVALWELRFELAWRTLRVAGLPRFAAVAVLAGVAWLLVAGLVLVRFGLPSAGPIYDAVLHSVFVGFVLSMVFAHAPIILPAVARVSLSFGRGFYVPLATLHGGLALRIGGDLFGAPELRRIGGLANALAIAVFVAVALTMPALERRARSRETARTHSVIGTPRPSHE